MEITVRRNIHRFFFFFWCGYGYMGDMVIVGGHVGGDMAVRANGTSERAGEEK